MTHNRLSLAMGAGVLVLMAGALPAAAQPAVYRPGAGATTPKPRNTPQLHVHYDGGRFAPGIFSKQQFNPDGRLRAPRGIIKPDATIPVADYNPNVPTISKGKQSVELIRHSYSSPYLGPARGPERAPLAPIDPKVITSGDQAAIGEAIRVRHAAENEIRDPMCRPPDPCDCPDDDVIYGAAPDDIMLTGDGLDPFIADGNKNTSVAGAKPIVADEPVLSVPEAAAKRLRDGKPDEAIVTLRSYVEANPDDFPATRALALALLDARRTAEGIELMGRVYGQGPSLAMAPIAADAVGQPQELREIVVRVVTQAHKANTPAAWLTAAVLMQAEGRREPALKMVDRADAVALKADVSSSIRLALRR